MSNQICNGCAEGLRVANDIGAAEIRSRNQIQTVVDAQKIETQRTRDEMFEKMSPAARAMAAGFIEDMVETSLDQQQEIADSMPEWQVICKGRSLLGACRAKAVRTS